MKEEIRFFRSVWKNILLSLASFVLAALGVLISLDEGKDDLTVFVVTWVCIPFSILGGWIIAYKVLKERLSQTPFLVITDKKVVINDNGTSEVPFADVEAFFLADMQIPKAAKNVTLIGIRYKEDAEQLRWDNANRMSRAVRKSNIRAVGAQEVISTVGLTIKPQALCDLLNKRLAEFKSLQKEEGKSVIFTNKLVQGLNP